MSGWTHITIESDKTQVEDEVDRGKVEEQISQLRKIKDRETEKPEELLQDVVDELEYAQVQAGTVSAEEKIGEWWKHKIEQDGGEYDELTYDPQTAKYGPRALATETGHGSNSKKKAQELMNECPYADKVLIISANDTSDSGCGVLYERNENGKAEMVDEHTGYHGAKGKDVTGYFREEHNISGRAWI